MAAFHLLQVFSGWRFQLPLTLYSCLLVLLSLVSKPRYSVSFLENIQGVRLALGPFRHPKPGMPPFLGSYFGRNGPLWEVRGIEFSTREPDFEPFSWFGHLHFR